MGDGLLDEQQEDGTGEGDNQFGENTGRRMGSPADGMKYQASDHGTDQARDDVPDETEPAASDDPGGDGSGDQADEEPSEDVMTSDGCEGYQHVIPPGCCLQPARSSLLVTAEPLKSRSLTINRQRLGACFRDRMLKP